MQSLKPKLPLHFSVFCKAGSLAEHFGEVGIPLKYVTE